MQNKLSDKQKVFVEEYLSCWNGYKAAVAAGYAENTARHQASRLLSYDNIQAAIAARLSELTMSADEVLARLTEHARGSIAPFLYTTGSGEPNGFNLSPDRPLQLVKKVSITDKGVSVELHDAQTALALLGKHHKLFTDKVEHTGTNGGPIAFKYEDAVKGMGDDE